jgi:superfamily II DNA helicase RecQ
MVRAFKVGGKTRVAITTSALSMGVNFPDARYVIHWGPPRNMLDYHQESGRAGRDGKYGYYNSVPWSAIVVL